MSLPRAAEPEPSIELLLYLAEFADDQGRPEDPIAITAPTVAAPNQETRESNEIRTQEPPSRPKRDEVDE